MFGFGRATLPEEGVALEVCKYMGWSWSDYCDAPLWLIDGVIIRMNEEALASREKK